MCIQKVLSSLALTALFGAIMIAPSTAAEVEWCYGPEPDCPLPPDRWAEKFPNCGGTKQSPVDIQGTFRNGALPNISFEYTDTVASVLNNGHTDEVEYDESAPDHIRIGEETCKLLQFHFHVRSEHEVGGNSFPMEAHLVHRCESGRLAVVGVMLHYLAGKPNPELQKALDHAPFNGATGKFVVGVNHDAVLANARNLLPHDTGNYYNYKGSLTTPPCSEIVDWYVLQNSVGISRKQMETFKKLLTDTSPDHLPLNNRPVQDLNGRNIGRRKNDLRL